MRQKKKIIQKKLLVKFKFRVLEAAIMDSGAPKSQTLISLLFSLISLLTIITNF
jgi:hypothetical protein